VFGTKAGQIFVLDRLTGKPLTEVKELPMKPGDICGISTSRCNRAWWIPAKDGKTTPAVVFGTKAGQIFVLDRLTGKPLTEVKELPMKPGDI
uniref:hypothetical protein n=1 Tax=Cronobacter dublinensis TaxID=413497 RepID=UPI0018F88FA5